MATQSQAQQPPLQRVNSDSQPFCRICHDESTSESRLIQPCECSGSLAYAHEHCLQMWLRRRLATLHGNSRLLALGLGVLLGGTFTTINTQDPNGNAHTQEFVPWSSVLKSDMLRCEICGYRFQCSLKTYSFLRFLLSRTNVWDWLHLAYIIFIFRRIQVQKNTLMSALQVADASGDHHGLTGGHSRWTAWWAALGFGNHGNKHMIMGSMARMFILLHYLVFLAFDIKYVIKKWLKWRAKTAQVLVYPRVVEK
mmetsp:Transcript_14505/g.25019  ORF Transcript_14505/g.25019 Transcript_14505/m.25019 type:complete len:253 (+) Transcript_14505:317-1075(+)